VEDELFYFSEGAAVAVFIMAVFIMAVFIMAAFIMAVMAAVVGLACVLPPRGDVHGDAVDWNPGEHRIWFLRYLESTLARNVKMILMQPQFPPTQARFAGKSAPKIDERTQEHIAADPAENIEVNGFHLSSPAARALIWAGGVTSPESVVDVDHCESAARNC